MIILDENFYIEADAYNYILYEKYIGVDKKTNEEKPMERTVGYYGNIETLLKGYLDAVIKNKANKEEYNKLSEVLSDVKKELKNIEPKLKNKAD